MHLLFCLLCFFNSFLSVASLGRKETGDSTLGHPGGSTHHPSRSERTDASLTGSWARPLGRARAVSTTSTRGRPRGIPEVSQTTRSTETPWPPAPRRACRRRTPRSRGPGDGGCRRRSCGPRPCDALADVGHGQSGQHAGEQRPGTQDDLVGLTQSGQCLDSGLSDRAAPGTPCGCGRWPSPPPGRRPDRRRPRP